MKSRVVAQTFGCAAMVAQTIFYSLVALPRAYDPRNRVAIVIGLLLTGLGFYGFVSARVWITYLASLALLVPAATSHFVNFSAATLGALCAVSVHVAISGDRVLARERAVNYVVWITILVILILTAWWYVSVPAVQDIRLEIKK
jgi:NADH:ubiquinone oxidoreductase subunit K